MAAVASNSTQANGLRRAADEVTEYQKILKLHDEIFAGVHPRFKVSASPTSDLPPDLSQLPVPVQWSIPTQTSTSVPEPKVPGLNLSKPTGDVADVQPRTNGISTKGSTFSTSAPSGLDPIFLTKSDELVRAEIQLQRQRLEKTLREQAEQKRNEARTKPGVAESKPDFDVTEVFEQALEFVKPITLSEIQEANANANANASASDSFDENSFYSSRAPDSTPEEGEDKQSRRKQRKAHVETIDLDDEGEIQSQDVSDDVQQAAKRASKPQALSRRDSRGYNHAYQQPQDPSDRYSPPDAQAVPYDDLDDEPEYSPPEAAEPSLATSAPASHKTGHKRRSSGRIYEQYTRRESPTSDTRTTRRTRQNGGVESDRTSPEALTLPRKRRKVQDGRKGRNKRGAHSPGPPIKDEPVSPPPFHDVPPLGTGAPRSDRPIYIDAEPPVETRYVPTERAQEHPQRPVYAVDSPTGQLASVRSVSRPIYREVARDNQDLRRVASLQHMQAGHQPEYAQAVPYADSQYTRAQSYAIIDRPAPRGGSVMYEGPAAQTTAQYVRADPVPASTSPTYREQHVMDHPTNRASLMPAPPPPPQQPQRRIIVDEAGNRYYENTAPLREVSMAPATRPIMRDPYETGPPQYTRASTVFEPPQREVRYVQDMPPPQFSTRASVAPRPEGYERVIYAPQEPQRSGAVQVIDYQQPRHQSVYVEDRHQPREEYVRMSNIRPAEPYGQERMFQRFQSVRPSDRAVSVFPNDRVQVPREYVPVDQAQYTMNQPTSSGSYYQVQPNQTQISLDGAQDIRYSVVPQQRY